MLIDIVVLLLVIGAIALAFVTLRSFKHNAYRSRLAHKVAEYSPPSSPWKGSRWLVFYNPFSGYGDGEFVYHNVLKPMFESAGVNWTGLKTESPGFACKLLSDPSFDLAPFCGIATISGDGVLHEILNGLFSRLENKSDAEFRMLLLKTPLALIPAGSSNGFATSLGLKDSFDGVKNIIENRPRPTDLLRVEISERVAPHRRQILWDFHTLSWAIGGEHDELQERQLRWMPTEIRNLVAPLFVILQAKQHRAVMDFIPTELSDHLRRSGHFSDETKLAVSPLRPSARRIDDTFIMSAIYNSPAGAHDILMSTTLRPDDGAIELMIIRRASPFRLLRVFLGFEDASYLNDPTVEHYRVSELSIEPKEAEGKMFVSGEKVTYGNVDIKNYHRYALVVW